MTRKEIDKKLTDYTRESLRSLERLCKDNGMRIRVRCVDGDAFCIFIYDNNRVIVPGESKYLVGYDGSFSSNCLVGHFDGCLAQAQEFVMCYLKNGKDLFKTRKQLFAWVN